MKLLSHCAAAFAVSVLVVPRLAGQDLAPAAHQRGANVTGTVFDSIGSFALRGASVEVAGAAASILGKRFTATTDSLGRYALSSLPPGQYLVGFHHARLDSLGLESEERILTVAEQDVRLDLATPSPTTYIALVCPDDQTGALLVGHVRRTDSQLSLPNATVSATWMALDTTNVFAMQRSQEQLVTTSPQGWYALCGLPGNVPFLTRGASGADSSGYARVTLSAGSVQVATFHVGGAVRTTMKSNESGAAAEVLWRGQAQVSGVVLDDRGQPRANARLTVWGTVAETMTDAQGRFRLDDLPGGTQTLEVRSVGFQPVERTVTLSAERPVALQLALRSRISEIAGMRVTATAERARLSAFHERKRDSERGINRGYFITPEDLERRKPTLITHPLEGLPGVKIIRTGPDLRSAVVHGSMRQGNSFCRMTVYLDGVRVAGDGGINNDFINVLVDPTSVTAIEVYPRPASAPPAYQSLNGTCGVVLLWTK